MEGSGHSDSALSRDAWDRLFEFSTAGMVIVRDGAFVRVNEAACDLFGVAEVELLGNDVLRFAQAVMGMEVSRAGEEFLGDPDRADPGTLRLSGPLVRPDGSTRQVAVEVTRIPDGDHQVVAATFTDLTDLHRARTEAQGSERRFQTLLANISDTVSVTDAAGRLRYTTSPKDRLLGYPDGFWRDRDPIEVIHPDDRERAADAWAVGLAEAGAEVTDEVRMLRADGTWADILVTGLNLLEDEAVGGIVLTSRDITPLRRAQRLAASQAAVLELIATGESLTTVAEACVDLVEQNGTRGRSTIYLIEGDRLEARAGRAPEAVNEWVRAPGLDPSRSLCAAGIAQGYPAIVEDFSTTEVEDGLRRLATSEGIAASWSQPIVSGTSNTTFGSLSTIYSEPHRPSAHEMRVADAACALVAIALEREENERRLAHLALHDGLTGLPNRTLLMDRLDQALSRRSHRHGSGALLFCDLDRFKVVNDSLGHGTGDRLLVAFAERLTAAVDASVTVARFGGDEFVVLAEGVDDELAAIALGHRISGVLDAPFALDSGQEVHLTASIGLAMAGERTTGESWLRDADAAMYRAKDFGRDRLVLFDDQMRDAAVARLHVENDLRRAVGRNELVVHYQPVVDLPSGRIVGAEALVRWQHPVRGLLVPAEFIAVAEDTGTIGEIGAHVLDVAVAAAAQLRDRHGLHRFQMGVNVSARQLGGAGLESLVRDTLQRHGVEPRNLLLEITESTLFDSGEAPLAVLADLRQQGVSLAIDDFGTGYSSLARLGMVPVDQVKVDRAFVAAVDEGDDLLVRIADAVVAIAGALDLATTAEGVESQAQLDHLRRIGCHHAQGYFFAKPLPLDELDSLVAADPRW